MTVLASNTDTTNTSTASPYRWRFFRSGGFDQVCLDRGEDLLHLGGLDQKLWVALACPTTGLACDSRTLEWIDTDHDGRIRAPEIVAAVRWACNRLDNPDVLTSGSDTITLENINTCHPEGQRLLAAAHRVLKEHGKPDATVIALSDITASARHLEQAVLNGDGVITVASTDNPHIRTLIGEIGLCMGAVPDRSGTMGITQETSDRFFADVADWLRWWQEPASLLATVFPEGHDAAMALVAFDHIHIKVEDFFARVRLVEFDARALTALNRQEEDYLTIAAVDCSITGEEIAGFPLARVAPGKHLPLCGAVNPAWQDALQAFHDQTVAPLLGDCRELTRAQWERMKQLLSCNADWQAAKPDTAVMVLGYERLHQIAVSSLQDDINTLIMKDIAFKPEADDLGDLEKLLYLQRDLDTLLNNFVSFRDFYTRRHKAIFQAGELYLDGRSCDLCLWVDDIEKHAAFAVLAKTFLVYCECRRPATDERRLIVAAFTDGNADQLLVGRNGVFYDRAGQDWDATIVHIVDHPISIRQAFWAPYRKLGRLVEAQVVKRASAKATTVTVKPAVVTDGVSVTAPPANRKMDVGTVAAIGVAMGSIGTFAAAVFAKFVDLGWWIPVAIVCLMSAVSLPAMVAAWFKLRQRNIGPILDACGWAMNTRAMMNVPFGSSLTHVAHLPEGAERALADPYQAKRSRLPWMLLVVLLLALVFFVVRYRDFFPV